MPSQNFYTFRKPLFGLLLTALVLTNYGCGHATATDMQAAQAPPSLPVIGLAPQTTTLYKEYPAALEGRVTIEVRPQVSGYLTRIFVDEGAYVHQGQALFSIDSRAYQEQFQESGAQLAAAKANAQKALMEVERLTPLVDAKVLAPVQLQTARQEYAAAKAREAQAEAGMGAAKVNLGYTTIHAPVSGYIGHIPYKIGSLVSQNSALPLTVLSDATEIYAYFSMSEAAFIEFQNDHPGKRIEDKIAQLPPVELILADNSIYPQKGRLSLVEGQFDKTVGAIKLRAAFPNTEGTLRSGNTGRLRFPEVMDRALIVPQESTFEIQDKVFVFALDSANQVSSKPISVSGKTAHYYFVSKGLNAGDRIVYTGTANLHDGMKVVPVKFSMDSLLQARQQ